MTKRLCGESHERSHLCPKLTFDSPTGNGGFVGNFVMPRTS